MSASSSVGEARALPSAGMSRASSSASSERNGGRPRHSFVSVDGMRLHWAELGDASDTVPVVLLHGLLDAHLTWNLVGGALAADRRVLMPDLPGCGLSERPDASYELGWHAQVIARWLETLGLESVDVIGHSFGGGVAQMLLLECRTRIRRMVLVASGGLGRRVGFWLRLATFPLVVELFGQPFMAFGTRRALGGASAMSKEDIAELSALNAQRGSARAFARTVCDVIDWRGQRRTFLQRAHEVTRLPPVAVFWGDRDAIIPIAHAKAFTASVEGVVFKHFDGCGHYLHQEQPEAFVTAVRDFLDDPSAIAARLKATDPQLVRIVESVEGSPVRSRSEYSALATD
jgi:pimeloyl-ACP methyl ester carboxylesterase